MDELMVFHEAAMEISLDLADYSDDETIRLSKEDLMELLSAVYQAGRRSAFSEAE